MACRLCVVLCLLVLGCTQDPNRVTIEFSASTAGGHLFAFQNGLVELQPTREKDMEATYSLSYAGTYYYTKSDQEKWLFLQPGQVTNLETWDYGEGTARWYRDATDWLTGFAPKVKASCFSFSTEELDYGAGLDALDLGIVDSTLFSRYPDDPLLASVAYLNNRLLARNLLQGVQVLDPMGKKVLLDTLSFKTLDFWASWCVPCRKQNRVWSAAERSYPLALIQLNFDATFATFQRSVEEDQISWPSYWVPSEEQSRLSRALGIRAYPLLLTFDKASFCE